MDWLWYHAKEFNSVRSDFVVRKSFSLFYCSVVCARFCMSKRECGYAVVICYCCCCCTQRVSAVQIYLISPLWMTIPHFIIIKFILLFRCTRFKRNETKKHSMKIINRNAHPRAHVVIGYFVLSFTYKISSFILSEFYKLHMFGIT